MIVITAPTSQIGSQLVAALVDKGNPCRRSCAMPPGFPHM